MIVRLIRIGKSRGVRIPKSVLEQCQVHDAVNLHVDGKRIVLTSATATVRQGWEEEAKRMHDAGDDALLIPDVLSNDPEVVW